jgi:putative membrane protein
MPGLGPAHGAVIAQSISGDIKDKGFLVLVGGLNTVNMILSLVTFYVLDKARNGSVIALSELISIDKNSLILILFFIFITGIINFFWAQKLTKLFAVFVEKIDYLKLSVSIITLISVMAYFLSGFIGLLILLTASFAGIIAPRLGVSRSHSMGCLMVPVISYFLF